MNSTSARISLPAPAPIPAHSPVLALVLVLVLATLTGCGASSRSLVQPSVTPSSNHVVAARAEPDLSEVPAPDTLLGLVRTQPPSDVIDRIGRLAGIGNMLRPLLDGAIRENLGEAAANVIDLHQPADAAWMRTGGTPEHDDVVMSFGAQTMDQIERAIGQSHRLEPGTNGVFYVVSMRAHGGDGSEGSDTPASREVQCAIAPAAQPRGGLRLLCTASSRAFLDRAIPYLTRTVPRREPPHDAIEMHVDGAAVRRGFASRMLHDLDTMRADALNEISTMDPGVRAVLAPLTPDLFDALRSAVNESLAWDVGLGIESDRVTLHNQFEMRAVTSSLVRATSAALNGQPAVPAELLQRGLPDGFEYFAGSMDARPFLPFFARVRDSLNTAVAHQRGLTRADVTAVRDALQSDALFDQMSVAGGAGFDAQGTLWMAATARPAHTTPVQYVASLRTWVVAMRRRNLARWLTRAMTPRPPPPTALAPMPIASSPQIPDFSRIRDLPARDLPPGAYGFEVPGLTSALQSATSLTGPPPPPGLVGPSRRGRIATPRPRAAPPTQVLYVPDGRDVVLAVGANARDVYQRYHASTTSPVDVRLLSTQGGTFAMAFVPAGILNAMRAASPTDAAQTAQMFNALPDHGRSPVTARTSSVADGDRQTFRMDVTIPSGTLRMIGEGASMFMANAP